MIFTLHRLFTRKGFEGYSAAHHYSDVAISAMAATTLAIKALSEGDPVSAKDAFETAAYLGAAVGAAASWRTALLSEPRKARAGHFVAKFFAGAGLTVALSSGLSAAAADAHEVQAARMSTQWHQMAAKQPSASLMCGPRVSGPERVYPVLKCENEKRPLPQTIAL